MQSELKKVLTSQKYIPLAGMIIAALVLYFLNRSNNKKQIEGTNIIVCDCSSVDSIAEITSEVVNPVLYSSIPDMREIHYKERTQKFIDLMLPSVLLACQKMDLKRERVLKINAAINNGVASERDSLYLDSLKVFYKTDDVNDVIKRLYPHPVSIIIAQAAIESGWATSRFCREGNNIFGIWSYNSSEKRIKAGQSRGDNTVYLRKYDSVFESVYDYLETIARANAYKQFREMRLYSDNPYRLIWYLNNYSEKRFAYVQNLRNMIEFNDLHIYDSYRLAKINKNDTIWKKLLD
ncbi:glucosaminidase domain-containing protein [Plebeiibacterium sediminum]|uniref:Glucosaminidase domain-containing protein n=1 Tax=Plebeiibacterium sediminum TaxID=2992112 RepID=A0AAE3M6P6_9BACT|nr:glucosaminidase domain-containing protein [Plebeiobacterium sediminum]MCW3787794.1 glucosaminidase domain-containing protein [Plebeiobacterium sediminum]